MIEHVEHRVDVSPCAPSAATLQNAVTVYFPDSADREVPTVVFAFPGLTYGRSFFDISVAGHSGYSLAEYLADRGFVVVACDHIGTGGSTPYEPFAALTRNVIIESNQAVVEQVVAELGTGVLGRTVRNPRVVALGHSMGAHVVLGQQALHATFDAVGLLGHTSFPREELIPAPVTEAFLAASDPTWVRGPHGDDALQVILEALLYADVDVPEEIKEFDRQHAVRGYVWPLPIQESAGVVPPGENGDTLAEAALIDVPIFLCAGDRETELQPLHREATAHPASTDVTIFIVPESGHNYVVVPNRHLLFRRLADWISTVVQPIAS